MAFYDQVTQIGYCEVCASDPIQSSQNAHLQYLDALLPLGVGDRVECRTIGEIYDGKGFIIKVSTDLHDGGTEVHPAYLVRLDDDRELLYTSICLTRIHERVR